MMLTSSVFDEFIQDLKKRQPRMPRSSKRNARRAAASREMGL